MVDCLRVEDVNEEEEEGEAEEDSIEVEDFSESPREGKMGNVDVDEINWGKLVGWEITGVERMESDLSVEPVSSSEE